MMWFYWRRTPAIFPWKDIVLLLTVLFSMLTGIFLPDFAAVFQAYPLPLLMFLLFLSFLSVQLGDIWYIMRRQGMVVLWLSFLKVIGLPILVFLLFQIIYPKYAVASLLLSSMATGVTAPFISSVLGANSALVLVMVAVTSPLIPFTVPALVGVLADQSVDISLLAMVRILCLIIFIPIFFVELLRRTIPKATDSLIRVRYPVSVAMFAIINLGIFSKYSDFFHQNPSTIMEATVVAVSLGAIYLLVGLVALKGGSSGDRIASAISFCNINNLLVIVFASEFFGPLEPTLGALYMIPYYGVILPLRAYQALTRSAGSGPGHPKHPT